MFCLQDRSYKYQIGNSGSFLALRTVAITKERNTKDWKDIACEQALLFGQAKGASRERTSEGPRKGAPRFLCPSGLRSLLARSRETRFTRPNRRACSQARKDTEKCPDYTTKANQQ